MIRFDPSIKLVLSDVDETIADVYTKATPGMIHELNMFLAEGRKLFIVSGGGLQSIRERVMDLLKPHLRQNVLIAHCSGAEVWGFASNGELHKEPFYGVYEGHFTENQKKEWRNIIAKLVHRFQLKTFPTQPRDDFIANSHADPLSIMLADRGPQITFEFTNSINVSHKQKIEIEKKLGISIPETYGTYDLRIPVMEEAIRLYIEAGLPVRPHLGAVFALDHIIEGVNKTVAIKTILQNKDILVQLGLTEKDLATSKTLEIWGDKFSRKKSGPDFQMCLAVSPEVRTIDFRRENPEEIPPGYNIQLWDGQQALHEGLEEYLRSSHISYIT